MILRQKGSVTLWIIILIVILGLIFISLKSSDDVEKVENVESELMSKDEGSTEDEMMKDKSEDEEENIDENEIDTTSKPMSGTYEDYSPSKVSNATGDILLFFHAQWCPTCRGLDSAIKSDMDMIPSDLTILKVDYDTSTELKAKYGVTLQHTLVQVDSSGNMITKWSGGGDVSGLVSKLK